MKARHMLAYLATGAALLTSATAAWAQTPDLKPNSTMALREFEPAPDEPYQIGRGDEISIDFGARPELDAKRTVGPDGRVTLPLAGSLELAGKTREAAADTVTAALAPYYSHLTATVGVDRYTSNTVLLLGAVEHPGVISFNRPPTLLEVLTRGGGLLSGARGYGSAEISGASFAGTAPAVPERCVIYRGADKVLWVDLKTLLQNGSSLADLRLRRDDVVYVPSPSARYVSLLGQVQHPGALQLDSDTTLPKLLAEAGGLTTQAGRNPEIRIVQPATGATRLIPFKSILAPGALDLTLHTGDVIYVPESGFNRFSYTIQQLSPLVTLFTTAALINR
jgi:polysaccharide export outer membrane protein